MTPGGYSESAFMLTLFKDLFLFYVCEPSACLVPEETGEDTRSSGTGVIAGCELPSGSSASPASAFNCLATM